MHLMTNTKNSAAVKPFKSERAAKIAMTKAEKAYTDAMIASNCAYRDAMNSDNVDPIAASDAANAARVTAYEFGAAVYAQAKSQNFYVRSWHFGENATRDLIAANID